MPAEPHEITKLLVAAGRGDEQALAQLTPLVYQHLHRLASARLHRERPNHTLQPTALLHEVYLKLIAGNAVDWENRAHFFAFAARLMRQILVDYARRHGAVKRSPGERVTFDEIELAAPEQCGDLLALDEALARLAAFDARKSSILELKYFAGMQMDEIVHALGISESTVRRELRLAEAWLRQELGGPEKTSA